MLTIYSDGGARGNPGPAAFAVVACRNGKIIFQHAEFIGSCTNNIAEYRGLMYAVGYALDSGEKEAEFVMDSELVIEQMKGHYKVRAKDLMRLYEDVKALVSNIPCAKFRHVRRSDPMITLADRLLNDKMDGQAENR